jgi:hypothetical protein
MYLMFIDESGTPPKPEKNNVKYFVIAGIIIPEESWISVRDALMGMKIRRGIRGEIKWRYFSPDNDDAKNPMRKLGHAEKNEIRFEVYKIISTVGNLTSIAAVCSTEAAYAITSVNTQEDIYHLTYKVISERFQYFLQDKKVNGKTQMGLMVSDHRGSKDDKRLRAHHQMLLHSRGGFTSTYRNLIESLFLQPSDQSIGIQLADMVAGAIWRAYERKDPQYASAIKSTFRTDSTGTKINGYGIVHVPKAGFVI